MRRIETVVATILMAFSTLENLFVTLINLLKKRSFVTLLADPYVFHPIVGINEDIDFLFCVVSQLMVNAMSRVVDDMYASLLATF